MNRTAFPPAVWATALATFIAFMGIGVVDPILPLIGREMGATPSQVEWLFSGYIALMAVTMLVSGVVGTRLGGRRTMLLGLGLVVVFASLCGLSPSVGVLAVFRAGWGLGNAFFTSTALALIVGLAGSRVGVAVTLYEAALGLGIASGPLLGGFLGSYSWRDPFFGTAALMAAGFMVTAVLVRDPGQREAPRRARDVFATLRLPPVLINALIGLAYSYAFFTILAYSPLTLPGLAPFTLGLTYFAWGLLVAFASVVLVNRLNFAPVRLLEADLLALTALLVLAGIGLKGWLLPLVVTSGLFCGLANALFTTLAMRVAPVPRPLASAAYNFLRWAGAAVAPALSGWVGQHFGLTLPFFLAAAVLALGLAGLRGRGQVLEAALKTTPVPGAASGH